MARKELAFTSGSTEPNFYPSWNIALQSKHKKGKRILKCSDYNHSALQRKRKYTFLLITHFKKTLAESRMGNQGKKLFYYIHGKNVSTSSPPSRLGKAPKDAGEGGGLLAVVT